mgnify:CR=1 FL=1
MAGVVLGVAVQRQVGQHEPEAVGEVLDQRLELAMRQAPGVEEAQARAGGAASPLVGGGSKALSVLKIVGATVPVSGGGAVGLSIAKLGAVTATMLTGGGTVHKLVAASGATVTMRGGGSVNVLYAVEPGDGSIVLIGAEGQVILVSALEPGDNVSASNIIPVLISAGEEA